MVDAFGSRRGLASGLRRGPRGRPDLDSLDTLCRWMSNGTLQLLREVDVQSCLLLRDLAVDVLKNGAAVAEWRKQLCRRASLSGRFHSQKRTMHVEFRKESVQMRRRGSPNNGDPLPHVYASRSLAARTTNGSSLQIIARIGGTHIVR